MFAFLNIKIGDIRYVLLLCLNKKTDFGGALIRLVVLVVLSRKVMAASALSLWFCVVCVCV